MNSNKTSIQRDKTGSTPLFYCVYNNRLFHAESVEALLEKSGIKPRIDAEGIAALTLLGPGRPKGNAVFAGIKELPPGYHAEFTDGKLTVSQYWKPQAKQHTQSFEETSAVVRGMLTNSIKSYLAESPCLFLSGGLDSSIIGAVMKEEGVPITSYSVDYEGNSDNFKAGAFQPAQDTPFIEEMREYLGCEHRDVVLDQKSLFGALRGAMAARGLPGMADVDSSLYLFCGEVAKECSFALSGECADELFGGYRWYFDEAALQTGAKQATLPWMECAAERASLLRDGALGGIHPHEYIRQVRQDIVDDTPFLESDDELTRKRREMFYLNYYGFMQTLTERNTAMSRAQGLQVHAPFSDGVLAEYAFNIPWEMKTYSGREKGLLRHAFDDILPKAVAWRKKSPFPKTHNPEYLRLVTGELRRIINAPDCRLVEIYDKRKLSDLIESAGAGFRKNWFGQLMAAPQIFAYLIQVEYWLREFDVSVV